MSMIDCARKFVEALNSGSEEDYLAIVSADAKIWHSFDNYDQSVEENLKSLEQLKLGFDASFELQKVQELENGFLHQHIMHLTNRQSGKKGDVFACIIATVKDGLIIRIEEYVDTGSLARLMES